MSAVCERCGGPVLPHADELDLALAVEEGIDARRLIVSDATKAKLRALISSLRCRAGACATAEDGERGW